LPRLRGFLAGIVVVGIILGIIFAGAGWLLGTVIGPAWNGIRAGAPSDGSPASPRPEVSGHRLLNRATAGRESVGRVSLRYALCFCHLTVLSADCAVRDDSRSSNGKRLVWRTSSPCFGLGRALPLLIAGLSTDFVKQIEVVATYRPDLERVFGVVFLGLGGYYMYKAWEFFQAYSG